MIVIGLTGGAGAGKDEAARVLKRLGAHVIDADKTGHRLLGNNRSLRKKLVKSFGRKILDSSGRIDRRELGRIAFGNRAKLKVLNRAIHPLMAKEFRKEIALLRKKGRKAVVLNAAVLFEAGWDRLVDHVILITAPRELRIKRLGKRGIPRKKALAMICSQWPDARKAKRSGMIIENNLSLQDLAVRARVALYNIICLHPVG
ncbi:dephospho-CoA kinase [Candidatus Desantisbacteria bacterium CG02_land_8_20_14_3_00_49_13]|nr:MAG: dephospho-CoA kinase [Candidatus Desantisbacteria bacterium CG1_02_49_89]PIV54218.1 MAG: dephospho-CoA kinase [Candidatus Desantisbacteria bacterium CG02_land_8_20_14_3_00_49_13]PJB28807.1 MAG: dephospho-CoA kinase [Candidatus Desantisbacteria bacterium CG_4_9_14_3_um_filter_50_7]